MSNVTPFDINAMLAMSTAKHLLSALPQEALLAKSIIRSFADDPRESAWILRPAIEAAMRAWSVAHVDEICERIITDWPAPGFQASVESTVRDTLQRVMRDHVEKRANYAIEEAVKAAFRGASLKLVVDMGTK